MEAKIAVATCLVCCVAGARQSAMNEDGNQEEFVGDKAIRRKYCYGRKFEPAYSGLLLGGCTDRIVEAVDKFEKDQETEK